MSGRCPACGAEVAAGARFCPACGAPQAGAGADLDQTMPTPPDVDATIPSGGIVPPPSNAGVAGGVVPPATHGTTGGKLPSGSSSAPSSLSGAPAGEFAPGTMVDQRYRIVGLLGRGGMGEVYRADDLTLGQSVALKFLPASLGTNPDRRHRFLNEVRTAREVGHPNVCRVYDVGEVEGHTYLSMEYIDGEDLASLLRRIGRLPQEKATEIARQLCAGLGALHDRSVLHRDLKPANVMIDGRGRVRITDFGLAGATGGVITGAEARAGTPAYMAPEQLSGERADEKSDIYALGLVLYEIYTGKRAFQADTMAELAQMQSESTPASVTTLLPDVDPAVERAIGRCLEKDPDRRPSSPIAVAASLPGGDPIAAALAAGEIPSVEMVAAAGERGGVRPWVGVACVAAVVVALLVSATWRAQHKIFSWSPVEKPRAVLVDRAEQLLADLGPAYDPVASSSGFFGQGAVTHYLARTDTTAERWTRLQSGRIPAVAFWYRDHVDHLVPLENQGGIRWNDPPFDQAGMRNVLLDAHGRLLTFITVPLGYDGPEAFGGDGGGSGTALPRERQVEGGSDGAPGRLSEEGDSDRLSEEDAPVIGRPDLGGAVDSLPSPRDAHAAAVDWSPWFDAAGLDSSAFRSVPSTWLPMVYADARHAWVGEWPELPGEEIRVEAATLRGEVVRWRVIGPWNEIPSLGPGASGFNENLFEFVLILVLFSVLVGATVMAVRNVRMGRGDRAGATRLASYMFLSTIMIWAISWDHIADPNEELSKFLDFASVIFLMSGIFFAFYLAIEPYVRKTMPDSIVAWSRLLTGRWRDPLIGRHVLVGGVFFLFLTLCRSAEFAIPAWMGQPPPRLEFMDWGWFEGPLAGIAIVIAAIVNNTFNSMLAFILVLVLRIVFRVRWIVAVVYVLGFVGISASNVQAGGEVARIAAAATLAAGSIYVLLRFGFLAFLVGQIFEALIRASALTADSSQWFFGVGLFPAFVVLAATLVGLWVALAGQSLFGDSDESATRAS